MEEKHAPLRGGKRAVTSAVRMTAQREAPVGPPAANDGAPLDAFDPRAEAAIEAAVAATVPTLRAHLRREFAARLGYLSPPRKRERVAVPREDEELPVDDLARAKARELLDRHDRRRAPLGRGGRR